MRVFINPGHDRERDSGAVNPNTGLRECDVAAAIGSLVKTYLETAGCEVQLLQSDNLAGETPDLPCVVDTANAWPADVFVSLHCNADSGCARGTETLIYANDSGLSPQLAACIQSQIVQSLDTVDRGLKERPNLIVLKDTTMPAVLVETAFIDNEDDAALLTNNADDFARAIARGITDFEGRY